MARMRFMDKDAKPPKVTRPFVKRIAAYFSPYKKQLAGVVALLLATALLGLAPPVMLGRIVDEALPGGNLAALALLVGLSVGATVLLNLIKVGQGYLSAWVSRHITFTIKNQLYRQLCDMPMSFFAKTKPGEITTRLNNDVDGIQEVFRTTVVNAISSILVASTTLAALFAMNWKLALVGIATIPLFILPTRRVGRARWRIAGQSHEKLEQLNQQLQQTMSGGGPALMKLSVTEEAESQRFGGLNEEVTGYQMKETLAGRWFLMTMEVFTTIGPMLVYLLGGLLLARGEMSVGLIVSFATMLARLYGPVTQISNIHIDLTRSFALFGRIFEYLDLRPDIADHPGAADIAIGQGKIRFEGVNFAYGDKPVLKDISFTARPGETLALVGPSGAGKTTLTSLLPRLYEQGAGAITIDGVDTRRFTLASLRGQIGMVTQEPCLFNGTIRENLRYGNKDATDEAIEEACRAAHIHHFIAALPEGYDTEVGNRGVKLSGGEKQRIAIARVLLKDPKILILDEATSALDNLSEQALQQAMGALMKGRTCLVIAHRLSTVQNADSILVLEDGRIAQQGSHRALLAGGGLYAELHAAQFAGSAA